MGKSVSTTNAAITPIVEPGSVRGMSTAQSPFALPAGLLPYLQNIRLDDNVVSARPGSVQLAPSVGTGAFRGWFEGTLDGVPYIWVALADPSTNLISVYESANGGAAWSAITSTGTYPATGPFGDTRMTDTPSDPQPVSFSIATDRGALGAPQHDCLVIQSGYIDSANPAIFDSPRVYGKAAKTSTAFTSGNFGMAVVDQPAIPTGLTVVAGALGSVPLNTCTASNSHAPYFEAIAGPVPLTIAESYGAVVGDKAEIIFAGPLDLSNSTQFIFEFVLLTDPRSGSTILPASPYDYQISLTDGSSVTELVWDPTTGTTPLSFFVDAGSPYEETVYYFCCPTTQMTTLNLATIKSVTVTLQSIHTSSGSGSAASLVYGVFASGNVQYGASFSIGYGASDARSVGPTAVQSTVQYAFDPYGYSQLYPPADDRVYISYSITSNGPPSPELTLGVDLIQVYAQLNGQSGYYLVDVVNYSRWNTPTAGLWNAMLSFPIVISSIDQQDFLHPDPQASALVCPVGTAMETANSRLFVGNGSTFWYSVFENPFLFYQAIVTQVSTGQLDPSSGASRSFDGETIQRIIGIGAAAGPSEALGSPITAIATLMVLTDQNFYQVAGYDSISLNKALPYGPHGTLSPMSAAQYENRVYWLDQRGQIRVFEGWNSKALSLEVVDDLTLAIPGARLPWVAGCCLNGRYYMAYSPSGASTNTHTLVYSEVRQMFESIDIPSGYTMEGIMAYFDQPHDALRLLCADASGKVVEHARPNNTAGDLGGPSVAIQIDTDYIHTPTYTDWAIVRDIGVFCDSVTGGTLSTSRKALDRPTPYLDQPTTSYDPNPALGSISIDMGSGISMAQQWDVNPTTSMPGVGMEGAAVQISLSGSVPGCWKLYALVAKLAMKPNGMGRP